MKIAVLGAGALGCAIGGTLAANGHAVVLINRNPAHVAAIQAHGLRMATPAGEQVVRSRAALDAQGLEVMDLVIVLVKSSDTRQAITAARALVGPQTAVLSLQNGLDHEDILAAVVGRERVLGGKTYVGGVMLGPGHILAGVAGKETLIGELDGSDSARVRAIAAAFSHAGLATQVSLDIVSTMWDKLLVNVATGAVSGISGLAYGPLYGVPEIEATALAAVQEVIEVARAEGIALACTDPRAVWEKARAGLSPAFKTSMLQSLEKGSATEVDFINGAVVRRGARLGIATPVNATLLACIKGIETALVAHGRPTDPPNQPDAQSVAPSAMPQTPAPATQAYVEHVAVRVRDIRWHIRFFRDVLGMALREIDGTPENPRQYWTVGGLQLMAFENFEAPPTNDAGWLAHLGVMVDDLDAALRAAQPWGVKPLPQGPNWLQLPDGLAVELIQAAPGSVAQALAVQPRR